jgi:hypothetical protein
MLIDKAAICPTDGLNSKFLIQRDESSRKGVKVSASLNQADLSKKILIQLNVKDMVSLIQEGSVGSGDFAKDFEEQIKFLSNAYRTDSKVDSPIAGKCGKCEFKCHAADQEKGLKSGYRECMGAQLGWRENDFDAPTVFELNGFRRKDAFIDSDRIKLSEIDPEDIPVKASKICGLSLGERQRLQIEKVQDADSTPFLDTNGLNHEMSQLVYPLHFIDFETTTVAIPFSAGRHPYQMVAFQYSHHIFHRDGSIEHKGEYLDANQTFTSNYDFARALQDELSNDEGSIFRYCTHENTVLNNIRDQLLSDPADIPDREELCDFIRSITKSPGKSVDQWEGSRCMIDLWQWAKQYYYDPYTHGSNSMKYILPAIMNSSAFLQEKYSKPIYGARAGIESHNFSDWTWVQKLPDGSIKDPYKLLPKLFEGISDKDFDILSEEDDLCNGGAALAAYGRMQFTEMSEYEKAELSSALLKYCELDTLAMVMLFEGWKAMIEGTSSTS